MPFFQEQKGFSGVEKCPNTADVKHLNRKILKILVKVTVEGNMFNEYLLCANCHNKYSL